MHHAYADFDDFEVVEEKERNWKKIISITFVVAVIIAAFVVLLTQPPAAPTNPNTNQKLNETCVFPPVNSSNPIICDNAPAYTFYSSGGCVATSETLNFTNDVMITISWNATSVIFVGLKNTPNSYLFTQNEATGYLTRNVPSGEYNLVFMNCQKVRVMARLVVDWAVVSTRSSTTP